MKNVEFAYTVGMDESAIEERLHESGTGVLALSNDGDAYAIPVAHYYDGENLYFRLGITDGSRKHAFITNTDTASYLLYDTEPTESPREIDSWSIVITGTLHELPAERQSAFGTAEINRRFSPIRVFDEVVDEIEVAVFEFDVDTVTGRTTPAT